MSGYAHLPDRWRARPFGDVLKRCVRSMRLNDRGKFRKLNRTWAELVGDAVAARTRILSYGNGELVVEVDSSVLLHELSSFMKPHLLAGLQGTPGGRDIMSIRFRLGPVDENRDQQAPQQ